MGLQLLIAVSHSPQRIQWEDVFRQIAGVTILDGDIQHLMRMSGLDALLMTGLMAHERFGGRPYIGTSQVLSTKPRKDLPPWIVTIAPFATHIGKHQVNSEGKIEIGPDHHLDPEEATYVVFTKAFQAIKDFNEQERDHPIRLFGFEPEFIHCLGKPRQEAEAVRKAYLEFARENIGSDLHT